uniref:Uncharacterized protein n=1 Tax=Ditylum brightwellii TaxID=49249 RepID=A0A7S4VWH5_9STRA|mmetsp:Transcript_6120/g.8001  ORF Transcript_6120/g.8001 Transcript_6120/m.8001 type:complete len:214 (-) Transcript_6120:73-714(-)
MMTQKDSNTTTSKDSNNLRRTHHKRKHAVCFNPRVTQVSLLDIPVSSAMTNAERCRGWYSSQDLKHIKYDMVQTGKQILWRHHHLQQQEHSGKPNSIKQPHDEFISEDEVCFRGLEYQTNVKRQERKRLCLAFMLKYQRRLRARALSDADRALRLAHASKKLSLWAREIALVTGRNDFLEAYPKQNKFAYSSRGHNASYRVQSKRLSVSAPAC